MSVARGSARSLLWRIVQAGSDAAVVFVTARAFGAEGRGLYALTTFAAALAATPFGGATIPLAAEFVHRRAALGALHYASVVVAVIGAVPVAAGFALLALAGVDSSIFPYAAAAAVALMLAAFQQGLFQVQGDVKRMHYSLLGLSVVALLAVSAVAIFAPGEIELALAAWAGGQIAVPVATVWLQRRQAPFSRANLRQLLRRVARGTPPVALSNAIMRLSYRIDLLVVAALLPLAQVGLYSVAVTLAEGLWLLSRALVTGAYSRVATAEHDDDASDLVVRVFRLTCLLLIVGGIAGVALGRLLLEPVFGEEFGGALWPFILLIPGAVGLGASEIFNPYFLVRLERPRIALVASAGGMACNLLLAVVLAPLLGISGAALATSVAYVGMCAFLAVRFARAAGGMSLTALIPRPSDLRPAAVLVRSVVGRRKVPEGAVT